ncbi:pyrroline-5-carboxylate reductase [Roseateles amylovorans]|uniref:Pyrroline-5-carboxylate reductase n=1 Tax=Roseateles amylovorans TaxID=2978473 RepID=A0ABY6B2P1_9BURK|nr:pyrroline-5-carboxylate reductase [Roseateles amylovorans]UXH78486.1 pyrroline-5-carboxylate reductase [Roseateles amylovorans]
MSPCIAFIGGGNMAGAIIGGLRRAGLPAEDLLVVEPVAAQRERLAAEFGVSPLAAADASLARAQAVVWAVKPQLFQEAAVPVAPWVGQALQLSVMAGLRSEAIAAAVGAARVVRGMPNTPALIGQGITGLYARDEVTADDRALVARILQPTGRSVWVDREADLDTVTALSGSGPAYFFFVIEHLVAAAQALGLSEPQARELALATCGGAAALAQHSGEPPSVLREKVTSKGGTTHAAISSLQADGVGQAVERAVQAAHRRARELGDEFGRV